VLGDFNSHCVALVTGCEQLCLLMKESLEALEGSICYNENVTSGVQGDECHKYGISQRFMSVVHVILTDGLLA